MNLPKNGKIVIIDNESDDIVPLAQSLSILESSVHIFQSFDDAELPDTPIKGVRLVFLDLELDSGLDVKNHPGNAKVTLEKIVDTKNRPFVVVVWTAKSKLFDDTKRLIETDFDAQVIMLEKTDFKINGSYDIQSIMNRVKSSLQNVEMVNLLGDWENILHDASIETSFELTNLIPCNGDWNKNMAELFKALAEARTGKQLSSIDGKAVIDNALAMVTATFLTKVYNGVRDMNFGGKTSGIIRTGGQIKDNETKAKINTQLLFTTKTSVNPLPGNIYKDIPNSSFNYQKFVDQCLKGGYKKNLPDHKMIYLIVNAMCDYAQKKWRTLRIVPGVVLSGKISIDDMCIKKDDLYAIPYVNFDDEMSHIVFDLGSVTSHNIDYKFPSPIFCLTYETLIDIQSRLASHVSRPGSVFLK